MNGWPIWRGVGVGVADPVEAHHHDEVGAGVAAHLLGERLDASADGSGVRSAATHLRGVGRPSTATASARSRGAGDLGCGGRRT